MVIKVRIQRTKGDATVLVFVDARAGKSAKDYDSAAQTMEAAMSLFKQRHPSFSGHIVLVGTGLDGAVLFDLLGAERLSFIPKALCVIGSALVVFAMSGSS